MKRILIFSSCLLLILLICSMYKTGVSKFNDGSQLVTDRFSSSPSCFASTLISDQQTLRQNNRLNIDRSYLLWHDTISNSYSLSSLFYIPQMVGWGRWIWWLSRRPQPYRNPLRAFRLNKKQRRRLRRRLSNLLALTSTNQTGHGLSSSLEWV